MKIIAGVDVSRNAISVCLLSQVPADLKKWSKQNKFKKFESTAEGVANFLALEFDAAVMEPTGGHYSKLWADVLKAAGRTILWVGHWEIASYRESWKVFNKTDDTDALALACYGLERGDRPEMFLSERSLIGLQLRELQLQREYCNRINNPLVNRIRQQLCHEVPELSERQASRAWAGKPSGIWKAIATSEGRSAKWEREISASIGSGISPFTAHLAGMITKLEELEIMLEQQVNDMLNCEAFQPYVKAGEPYFFGKATLTAIISTIYPIEKFDGSDNPLAAVKLACGMGLVWRKSGDFEGWTAGGDASVRQALWRWAMTIATQKPKASDSDRLAVLKTYYRNGATVKDTKGNVQHLDPGKGSQRLMRVARRAITMYYRDVKASLR